MNRVYGVYGASGFGKEVMPLLEKQLEQENVGNENIFFIDDNSKDSYLNGYQIINFEDFLALPADERYVSIAIGSGQIREVLAQKCLDNSVKLLDVKADNVVAMSDIEIGQGSVLCPFVTLTSNIKIGQQFHANLYSYVAHDCVIGDYVTFAPAVKCNGNVVIEDHAYIGTGAIIKQGEPGKPIRIGKGAVVAAGAFVNKDVPDGVTVFGSPAIELTRENLKKRNG